MGMNFLFLLITIAQVGLIFSSDEYIQLDLNYFYQSRSLVHLVISEGNVSLSADVDVNSSFSFVNINELLNGGNNIKCKVLKEEAEFNYRGSSFKGSIINSLFKFRQHQEKPIDLSICLTSKYTPLYHSSVGFALTFEDSQYSLIHQFKSRGFINSLSFAFVLDSPNHLKRSFFLGTLPHNYTSNQSYGVIDIIGLSSKWDFYLSQVLLKNASKQIASETRDYAYLISIEEYIYTPSSFFEIFLNDYLKEAIQLKLCYVQHSKPQRYILCQKDSMLRLGQLSFQIGNFTYGFSFDDFWSCGEDLCLLLLRENKNEDGWILGLNFYKRFNTVFDYEKKQIHLYAVPNSHDNVTIGKISINHKTRYSMAIQALSLIAIFCLVGGVLLLIFTKN